MQTHLAADGKSLALKGVLVQILTGIGIIILTALFWSAYVIAVVFGVLSFIIPHSIFAYWVFRYAGATKNQEVARSLSQGMKIKLALTTLFFVIAFAQFGTHPLFLLGAYIF